ncbi:MAG: SdpI family protein, partial [Erysipelotrichaceae bacterium]|nr:SdpI family protein [Erysipelotrichaceae bacterium]
WNKTHRFAGFVFVLMGLWMIVSAVFSLNVMWSITPALVCAFLPMVYSYLLYRKESGGKEE